MPGNSFGEIFKITTAGESHGPANTVIIDGCPSGIPISQTDFTYEMKRRQPGQSKYTTQRHESDQVEILSGVFDGLSTGTPIALLIRNTDQRSKDYDDIKHLYRPGHADFSYEVKYGFRDYRGGGRSSARETVARVAAGVIASKICNQYGVEIFSYSKQIGHVISPEETINEITKLRIEANPVRCPNEFAAKKMMEVIDEARKSLDSIGGIAETVVLNLPAGLGEPIFNRLKAQLAHAMFSIPAVCGVEFGSGFSVATKRGSENNDSIMSIKKNKLYTATNNHGGILGGISTGMPIIFRSAVKATSSIAKEQLTVDRNGKKAVIKVKGRHDPCLLPRFIPVADAMTAIVIADMLLHRQIYAS